MFANYDLDYVNLAIEEGSIPQPAFECRAAPRVPYPVLFHCIPIGFPGEQLRLLAVVWVAAVVVLAPLVVVEQLQQW